MQSSNFFYLHYGLPLNAEMRTAQVWKHVSWSYTGAKLDHLFCLEEKKNAAPNCGMVTEELWKIYVLSSYYKLLKHKFSAMYIPIMIYTTNAYICIGPHLPFFPIGGSDKTELLATALMLDYLKVSQIIPLFIPFPLLNHHAEQVEVEFGPCGRDPTLEQQTKEES